MGKIRTSLEVLSLGLGLFTAEALYSGNERFYRDWFLPAARFVVRDGETAHNLSLYAASHGFIPRKPRNVFPSLKCKVFGLEFDHPVGLAAGFDKNGEAFMDLLNVGFSHIEVGTVTPNPQPGNSRPRIFRWTEKNAIINRCGFNNDGHDTVYERLKNRPWEGRGVLGVNLGCNKTSIDPTSDYVAGVRKFGEVADYLVINVSSPNTPGLRSLQAKDKLRCLLSKTRIDGIIVSNTTLATYEQAMACGAAPILKNNEQNTNVYGGLSGRPLFEKSTDCLKKISELTKGAIPLIGVGGISSGEDALSKLNAGASLVQLYTSFVYQGPPVAHKVARELNKLKSSQHLTTE
ncbi:Dihydroorotate dehydrogenase (quinone) isoform 2 [Schistosoma japonicum]|uniref:Dihydroorotate dehydrogenase (quinone), mitochondrial n=1 Tax=Schistosoma japonicum TaxID=6182 RepID=A0A4Z2DXY0_SCHJA|nr:Dihydroorotate dehydrogenase (quinone) isoform 2 [Schistosoma japonicum]